MKKMILYTLSTLLMVATTLTPQTSHAKNNLETVAEVIVVGAIVLAILDDADLTPCNSRYENCGYHDHYRIKNNERCEYQAVTSTEISTQCNQYGRYSTYSCVRTRSTSTVYLESCGRSFDRHYSRR